MRSVYTRWICHICLWQNIPIPLCLHFITEWRAGTSVPFYYKKLFELFSTGMVVQIYLFLKKNPDPKNPKILNIHVQM